MKLREKEMNDIAIVAAATIAFMAVMTIISFLPLRKKEEKVEQSARPEAYIDHWVGGNSEARKRREERLAAQGEHNL